MSGAAVVTETEQGAKPDSESGNTPVGEPVHEFFATSIEPETNRLLSEDYHFCRVARLNGYKIYAAPWVTLGHFGTYLFEGGLIPAP